MWNRQIESDLRENKRVEGSRFEGSQYNWLVLMAIVLAVIYAPIPVPSLAAMSV